MCSFSHLNNWQAGASIFCLRSQRWSPDSKPHLIAIPYLHLGENDYIYRFRVERERNHGIYVQDPVARVLYQSRLCEAIKALNRTNERSANRPASLDFGAVCYVIPSHFGFCLGVKNAIERAYETLAENPGRRVFMLSELIHNPFVNEDLLRRGLRFLQTDKGQPFATSGGIAQPGDSAPLRWDTLTGDDIVIIPAFGATDEDKKKADPEGHPRRPVRRHLHAGGESLEGRPRLWTRGLQRDHPRQVGARGNQGHFFELPPLRTFADHPQPR